MSQDSRFKVAVVGGGPAGLMAAEVLARAGATVTVYDRMASVGRKLLLAGRGGLNLTHSEDLERFLARYGAAEPRLRAAIEAFPPAALVAWCEGLGQPTFVGSSGRVFPSAMKASPLLRSWLARLAAAGVAFKLRHRWEGWGDGGRLMFSTPGGASVVEADATILALGGASWPRLGSDGGWVHPLTAGGVAVSALVPTNCGFQCAWSEIFRSRFEGEPLKRVELSFHDQKVRGELVVTRAGLEGGAIYSLSARLREGVAREGEAGLQIDLRPDTQLAELEQQLGRPRGKQSLSTFLRKSAKLPPVAIGLLHEVSASAGRAGVLGSAALAQLIKSLPVRLTGTAPIERAISTAGGVAWDELDVHLMLRRRPGTFVAGEMIDWEAPTGGYLLQASLATGMLTGDGVLQWLGKGRH